MSNCAVCETLPGKRASRLRTLGGAGGALAAIVAAALTLSGCVGYRLGTTLPPGIASVYIPTALNETEEPQLETEVTRAVVREFQRDGTLKVADAAGADVRLEITVTDFTLEPLRYERDRAKTTREYRMRITADIVLTRSGEAEPMMNRRVTGDITFDFFGDLASSKLQALPDAADDLAHDIVESIVEYW